jgi:superfamily I DNA and/or RNA helicase
MERLIKIYGDTVTTMLSVQYRMNSEIMQFSSTVATMLLTLSGVLQ